MNFSNQTDGDVMNGSSVGPPVIGATIVSPTLMFLAGVLGNILALCVLYRTRTDVKSTQFYTFVSALVWTDLLGIVMTSPSVISAYVNGIQWAGGTAHCHYHGFVMTCFGLASPVIICAMAIERFVALKCVFFYSTRCTNVTARGVILALLIGVVWYSVLPLFGIGHFEKQYPNTWCFFDFHSTKVIDNLYGYIYASLNLSVVSVMTFCNVYVMCALVKARLRWDVDGARRERLLSDGKEVTVCRCHVKQNQKDVEIQMIILLCALTTVFALCWSPLMIQIIITMATKSDSHVWDLAGVRLASLNQTLDPWLYILLRRSLCVKVKNLFKQLGSVLALEKAERGQKGESGPEHVGACGSQNNERVFSQERHERLCQNSKPDLLDVTDSEMADRSPLPDVASNKQFQHDCICQIHIEKNNDSRTVIPDDKIFVKFLIVSKERSSGRSSDRS